VKTKTKGTSRDVLINLVDVPEHIDREEIDDEYVNELAGSIRELGLLQPIVLRSVGTRYELIAGHMRLLAHKVLGRQTIVAVVKEFTDKESVLARAVENLQRMNLTIIEEAKIYNRMVETLGMTFDEIAKMVGKAAGTVRRKLSLLKLQPILQTAIHKGMIIYSVGEELNTLGDVGKIEYYLGYCIDHGATLPVVRQWVQDEKSKMRQNQLELAGSRGSIVIPRSMPVYVPCELCLSPMSIGTETVVRCCPDCAKKLTEIMKSQP
jgi:ParB/RepB/Spo0J family partition protein